MTITIMKCQGFWIYELPPPSVNRARYCGNKGKKRDGHFNLSTVKIKPVMNVHFLKSGKLYYKLYFGLVIDVLG